MKYTVSLFDISECYMINIHTVKLDNTPLLTCSLFPLQILNFKSKVKNYLIDLTIIYHLIYCNFRLKISKGQLHEVKYT